MNKMILGLTNSLLGRINLRCVPLAVGIATFVLSFCSAQAQTAADLQETIERHYAAINGKDRTTVRSHHLPEMSIFTGNGHMLRDRGDSEARERVGFKRDPSTSNLFISDFKAQIYGNVGVAMFYLVGSKSRGDAIQRGTWRVTAVWVHEKDAWKEAHHHESPLVGVSHY